MLASLQKGMLRGDFCGPDGSPLISLRADSTGFLFYYPDQGRACFQPRGFPLNTGVLSVNALISMIRTGFPAVPVPWQMTEMHEERDGGGAMWRFTSSGEDTMNVILRHGSLFPSVRSGDTIIEVTATSWHDSFVAWPSEWLLSSSSANLVARLRSMENHEITDDSRWELIVPVPVDTLMEAPGEWNYSGILPLR